MTTRPGERSTAWRRALAWLVTGGLACSGGRREAAPADSGRDSHGGTFVTTADSVRLWYRVVGTGSATVIVPAALYHRDRLDGLARGRRLVLYDPRGRGRSDPVPPAKSTLEHELDDLETIRRTVGADSFALVGWSALGLEGFVYALRYPGRVTRLVQMAPLAPRKHPWWEALVARRAGRVDSAARARLDLRIAAGEFKDREADLCRELARINEPAGFGDTSLAHLAPDVCDSPNEWPARNGEHARAVVASYGDYDWRPMLGRVTIPRLVIHGDKDNFPLEGSREWVAGQPNARLLLLSGAGHWVHYERPDAVLEALEDFLSGRWPEAAQPVAP